MPQPARLEKALLQEITWDENQVVQELERKVTVQFNPETLKVSYANQSSGGDQRGGSATQFVGQGTTKLSFDLWLDVTAPQPPEQEGQQDAEGAENDVRRLTEKIVKFIQPKEEREEGKFVPPGMRFLWGSFKFDGIVDSINETLEFFSEDGRPLRAGLNVSLSKQEIQFQFNEQFSPNFGGNPAPGSQPLTQARQGDSAQSIMARSGRQDQWQSMANANDIDNPRQIPPGTPLNTRL